MSSPANLHRAKLLALPGLLLAKSISGLAFWAPVVLATGFFALIAFKGLKPALEEQRRLDEKTAEMSLVSEELVMEEASLEHQIKAQSDPIYRERLRRIRFVRTSEAPKASTVNRLLSHIDGYSSSDGFTQ